MNSNYDDIINMPRPVSKKHPPMPLENRAAQFAPFAALTGYDKAIDEVKRQIDELEEQNRRPLSDEEIFYNEFP